MSRSWPITLASALLAVALSACSSAPATPTPSAPKAAAPVSAPSPAAVAPAASPVSQPAASPVSSPAAAPASGIRPSAAVDPSLASVWQGKTITLVVGAEAGGGYDTWARLAAKHLQKQLPGNPNIIVQNMPGGNHRVATNYLYGMKGDGLTLGLIERYIPSYQLSGEGPNEGVRFDVTKFDWIGSAAVTTPALVVHQRIGITPSNLEQLKQRPIRVAQQAPGSSQHIWAVLSREILGYKFENIFGFKSNPEASLSMRRGETEGMITDSETLARIFDQEFKTGEVLALMLYGDRKPGSVWEKAPTIMDLVGDKNAEAKQMVDFARLPFSWSRPFLSPPGTPATVVATLRAAFTTMMADPEFLADADQQKLEVTPLDGASMTTLLTDYMKTPKAIIDKVNAMIEADSPR